MIIPGKNITFRSPIWNCQSDSWPRSKQDYQDIEGNNNEDENKQKFNKKASKQRSQLADWPRQAPGSNAIGETQSQPESSEAGKSISQHAPAINRDRKADTNSDNETNKVRNIFNDF